MILLENTLKNIEAADSGAAAKAWKHIDNLTKPLGSLGKLEEIAAKYAGITGKTKNKVNKKNIIVMCADNGVCEEGVSSAPQEITAIMTNCIPTMTTGVGVLAKHNNAELTVVDVGVKGEVINPDVINRRIIEGTNNIAKGPAMSRDQAVRAIETGIEITDQLVLKGYDLFGTGEMGIGNTTTSTAVIASILNLPVKDIAGKGVGLTAEQYNNKIAVIERALEINKPDSNDAIDVLTKVGGLDIAAMCGCFLSAAKNRKPIVIDGLISCAAVLCAVALKPEVKDYIFASHKSAEKAVENVFEKLEIQPMVYLDMRLGEGSGCPFAFNIIESALAVVNEMATFGDAGIEEEMADSLVDIRN